jgi:hypothetical protein
MGAPARRRLLSVLLLLTVVRFDGLLLGSLAGTQEQKCAVCVTHKCNCLQVEGKPIGSHCHKPKGLHRHEKSPRSERNWEVTPSLYTACSARGATQGLPSLTDIGILPESLPQPIPGDGGAYSEAGYTSPPQFSHSPATPPPRPLV